MRRKAPDLASHIGDLMKIHQGKDQGIEHSEHLSHRGNPNPASVLPEGHIAAPVEAILNGIITNDKFCLSQIRHLPKLSARKGFPQEIQYPSEATEEIRCPKVESYEETTVEHSTFHQRDS
jgi:hypothetical protein